MGLINITDTCVLTKLRILSKKKVGRSECKCFFIEPENFFSKTAVFRKEKVHKRAYCINFVIKKITDLL